MNSRQRLLVVHDSAKARKILSEYLDGIGYRARFASSGEEAVALLRGGLQTDAVIYDATMPVMAGRAFVRQLRSTAARCPCCS
jgi:CheY-like chemotaxis protein